MIEKNVQEFVMNERNILNTIDNDFIVRGIYTFQSRKYLYMVMEYMKGGDFGTLLDRIGCFNYERAKFYIAHIVAALEHLHGLGIVHRDLIWRSEAWKHADLNWWACQADWLWFVWSWSAEAHSGQQVTRVEGSREEQKEER